MLDLIYVVVAVAQHTISVAMYQLRFLKNKIKADETRPVNEGLGGIQRIDNKCRIL